MKGYGKGVSEAVCAMYMPGNGIQGWCAMVSSVHGRLVCAIYTSAGQRHKR